MDDGSWPISEVAARLFEVRLVGRSGPDLLTMSSSHFDSIRTFGNTTSAFLSYAIASILGADLTRGSERTLQKFIPNIRSFSQNISLLLALEPLPIVTLGQTTSDRALKQTLEQVGYAYPLQT